MFVGVGVGDGVGDGVGARVAVEALVTTSDARAEELLASALMAEVSAPDDTASESSNSKVFARSLPEAASS